MEIKVMQINPDALKLVEEVRGEFLQSGKKPTGKAGSSQETKDRIEKLIENRQDLDDLKLSKKSAKKFINGFKRIANRSDNEVPDMMLDSILTVLLSDLASNIEAIKAAELNISSKSMLSITLYHGRVVGELLQQAQDLDLPSSVATRSFEKGTLNPRKYITEKAQTVKLLEEQFPDAGRSNIIRAVTQSEKPQEYLAKKIQQAEELKQSPEFANVNTTHLLKQLLRKKSLPGLEKKTGQLHNL
ncbi:MAG: hypothetical protein WCL30_04545 [Pseudomonadota bacterium]